jgi:6-pyruvoyltetrahydropterin/6-carboxytetrahydropterin synthase
MMFFELSQTFYFEAAHTLERKVNASDSRCIHGHTYHAQVYVRGVPDDATGMLVDIDHLKDRISTVRAALDHRFLDDVPEIGTPTIENLCLFVYEKLRPTVPGLVRVAIERPASGDRCDLHFAS